MSGIITHRQGVARPASASFNVVSDIGWHTLFYAGGPEFVALGLAADAAVASWPDEKSTHDLAQATGTKQPLYRATGGANSKPGVQGDGVNDFLATSTFTAVNQPFTLVAVGSMSGTNLFLSDSVSATCKIDRSAGSWRVSAGTNLTLAGADTSPHAFRFYVNGASSVLKAGASSATGAAGANTIDGVTLFSIRGGASLFNAGVISFWGLFAGDLTGDANWSNLVAWVSSEYGLTLS